MSEWVLSLTPMLITKLVADDTVLVRLAQTYDPCSNVDDIWLR